MQGTIFSCDGGCGCQNIAGESTPLVVYIVVGQVPNSGAPVDLNAPGVKVPAIVRELMAQPVPRREYCVRCFAKAFGLELVAATPIAEPSA